MLKYLISIWGRWRLVFIIKILDFNKILAQDNQNLYRNFYG